MSRSDPRSGVAPGDVLLLLATLAFVAALSYPRITNRALNARISAIEARVEVVRDAALRYRGQAGAWPDRQSEGQLPPEVRRYLPPGFSFQGDDHLLTWDRFEQVVEATSNGAPAVVEIPDNSPNPEALTPAAPDSIDVGQSTVDTLAAISVHSDDTRVLGALLDHFGPARSFIRAGAWTLVLPQEAGPPDALR